MIKQIRCYQCRRVAFPPVMGWLRLGLARMSVVALDDPFEKDRQFCSPECALLFLRSLIEQRAGRAKVGTPLDDVADPKG